MSQGTTHRARDEFICDVLENVDNAGLYCRNVRHDKQLCYSHWREVIPLPGVDPQDVPVGESSVCQERLNDGQFRFDDSPPPIKPH